MTEQYYTPPNPSPYGAPQNKPGSSKLKLVIIVALVLVVGFFALVFGSFAYFAQRASKAEAAAAEKTRANKKSKVPSGIRITSVTPFSKAASAGLEQGDIIVMYDGTRIQDQFVYRQTVDAVLAKKEGPVEMVVSRGDKTASLQVPTGLLGFNYEGWTLLKDEVFGLVAHAKYDAARDVVSKAEQAGDLSPRDLLIVNLRLINDDAGPEDASRRDALVDELIRLCPGDCVGEAAHELDGNMSLRAAVPLYQAYLKHDPTDVGARLNLANSLALLGDSDEAERQLNVEMLKPEPPLSEHGFAVAEQVMGFIAANRGRSAEAALHFRRHMEMEPDPERWGIQLRYMYHAGRSGGLEAFREARSYCQKVSGSKTKKWQCHIDAVEASLLIDAGDAEAAAALIEKWRGHKDAPANVLGYWSQKSLCAPEVADRWQAQLGLKKS